MYPTAVWSEGNENNNFFQPDRENERRRRKKTKLVNKITIEISVIQINFYHFV